MGGRFELFALALLLVIGAYSEIEASIGPQALESTILRYVMSEGKHMQK